MNADEARWTFLPQSNVEDALERALEKLPDSAVEDQELLVQVALARKLARRIDAEVDGTKLAALSVRFRQVVSDIQVGTEEGDLIDEVAKKRREREQRVRSDDSPSGTDD